MTRTIIAPSGGGGGASSPETVATLTADVVHTTNSTTLENITGLTFSTTASPTEVWWVEALLILSTNASGGSTSDYKLGWSVSGAQTGRWGGNPETGVGAASLITSPSLTQTLVYGSVSSATGEMLVHLRALIRANNSAGAVQLRFAQNLTAASAVATVKVDSTLIAKRVRT